MSIRYRTCVLFGGNGFIGINFAKYLREKQLAERIILADLRPPESSAWSEQASELCRQSQGSDSGPHVSYVPVDVRQPITNPDLPSPTEQVDLVANFAAIHREPGHHPEEYFQTNLPGAEYVCSWAEQVGCPRIIFTSSIAPYGPTEEERDENTIPVPVSPYGASKLAAEKIHLAWQRAAADRSLLIVRPGVVFGPGEGGNLTRLIRAVLGRYFFYMGNRHTRKAGGYVKELCTALIWNLHRQETLRERCTLFNFTMDPAPTVEEYVRAICRVAKVQRTIPSIPYSILLGASYPIEASSRLFGMQQPISPVRIRKLVRSNNIVPAVLRKAHYTYQYSLEDALADWRRERQADWE